MGRGIPARSQQQAPRGLTGPLHCVENLQTTAYGSKPKQASALEAAVTHGNWSVARVSNNLEDQLCPRCGEEADMFLHRYWTCNDKFDDDCVKSTQGSVDEAKTGSVKHRAYWLGGVLPASLALPKPQAIFHK